MRYLVLLILMIGQLAWAASREVDDYHWTGVERIVAIGDIHGDYEHYLAVLQDAALVNSKGKWTGGETHLVQVGDVPDRGPDTLKIIEHLQKLAKEAGKKGGMVHSLIGNHEAMNVYGDLSYTTPQEFAAFADRNSASMRDRYFEIVLQSMQQNDPAGYAELPENFRELWDKDHPLGWLEHRQAWSTAWNPQAKLAAWVFDRKVAIQIDGLIFLHGGISGFYCQNSLQSLTEKVVSALRTFDPDHPGIVQDEFGPLWYRGLSGRTPEADPETVQAILQRHDAQHIVVGHTPTGGAIWPRYNGSVIQIDTGISAFYGGHVAYLEVTPDGMFAGYPGGKIKLPSDESGQIPYLEQVVALEPENTYLQQMLVKLKNPAQGTNEIVAVEKPEPAEEVSAQTAIDGAEAPQPTVVTVPTCGISE